MVVVAVPNQNDVGLDEFARREAERWKHASPIEVRIEQKHLAVVRELEVAETVHLTANVCRDAGGWPPVATSLGV
jgi:hypothetical protein